MAGIAFGQTQVPNTFQSGQPARAAEVNDNFATVETAVNDNASDISSNTTAINSNSGAIQANTQAVARLIAIAIPRVKANGQEIGTFLDGFSPSSSLEHDWFVTISILSDAGYIFTVAARDRGNETHGEVLPRLFWYETPNCTGTAYVAAQRANSNFRLQSLFNSGEVFSSSDSNDPFLYYTPKGSMATTITVQSQNGSGACNAQTETHPSVPILPNDPAITGVANQRKFNPPITIGIQIIEIP